MQRQRNFEKNENENEKFALIEFFYLAKAMRHHLAVAIPIPALMKLGHRRDPSPLAHIIGLELLDAALQRHYLEP